MRVVGGLVAALERAGAPRAELLGAVGLEASRLASVEERLPRSVVFRICEVALDCTGDPALGLHWAERLTGNAFSPLSYLMVHSPRLRDALESLVKFSRLLSDEPSFELVETADEVTLRRFPLPEESERLQRFLAEMLVASFFHILSQFRGSERTPRPHFDFAAPSYRHEYARLFGGAERFQQQFSGIVFDRALMDVASPQPDPTVHEALAALIERRMTRLAQHVPYALRVRELLVERGWPAHIDMPRVARTFGLSARSLRRRLAHEGTSYSDVENEAFAIVASHVLLDEQRTIQETAYELGFSDTTTFHRAFKRATGMTPTEYRAQQAGRRPR